MDYFITWDIDEFIAHGLRMLEDYLLIHAAFQAQYPDEPA